MARTKKKRASVVQKSRGASGVAARPPTAIHRDVAIAKPPSKPTIGAKRAGRKSSQPMRHVSRQVPIESKADANRAPVSFGPASQKPAIWSQLVSTGFSMRKAPFNVGTTQSPRSSMAREQAAFLGSSSSQSAGPPRLVSSTTPATVATSRPCRYVVRTRKVPVLQSSQWLRPSRTYGWLNGGGG